MYNLINNKCAYYGYQCWGEFDEDHGAAFYNSSVDKVKHEYNYGVIDSREENEIKIEMNRYKTCASCKNNESIMYRVQFKSDRKWYFLCKPCTQKAKMESAYYRYGGTWKG